MSRLKFTDIDKANENETDKEVERDKLNKRLLDLKRKKDRIQRAWISEMMSDDDLQKYQNEINAEKNKILERLDKTQQEKRSEEHTSELQSRGHLVCRLLLEKKKKKKNIKNIIKQYITYNISTV